MRRIVTLLTVLMLFGALAYGQTRPVTGKVTDAQGKAVPFASVTVKGTNAGVAADENGSFTIDAAPNSTLVFSAAGFETTEVKIGNQTSITATITSQSNMSEVVVTALGVRRSKNTLPYAAQQVAGTKLVRPGVPTWVLHFPVKYPDCRSSRVMVLADLPTW